MQEGKFTKSSFLGTPLVKRSLEEAIVLASGVKSITVEDARVATLAQLRDSEKSLVKNSRGRFHGAFTGGFHAGHRDTVGSAEGWRPKTFQSSRSDRTKDFTQSLDDLIDEEDLESGIGRNFSAVDNPKRHFPSGISVLDPHVLRVNPVCMSPEGNPLAPRSGDHQLSPGKFILKRMGWRGAPEIGIARMVRSPAALIDAYEAEVEEQWLEARRKRHDRLFVALNALQAATVLCRPSVARLSGFDKLNHTGFGTGVLEDDDDLAVYGTDDVSPPSLHKTNYNFASDISNCIVSIHDSSKSTNPSPNRPLKISEGRLEKLANKGSELLIKTYKINNDAQTNFRGFPKSSSDDNEREKRRAVDVARSAATALKNEALGSEPETKGGLTAAEKSKSDTVTSLWNASAKSQLLLKSLFSHTRFVSATDDPEVTGAASEAGTQDIAVETNINAPGFHSDFNGDSEQQMRYNLFCAVMEGRSPIRQFNQAQKHLTDTEKKAEAAKFGKMFKDGGSSQSQNDTLPGADTGRCPVQQYNFKLPSAIYKSFKVPDPWQHKLCRPQILRFVLQDYIDNAPVTAAIATYSKSAAFVEQLLQSVSSSPNLEVAPPEKPTEKQTKLDGHSLANLRETLRNAQKEEMLDLYARIFGGAAPVETIQTILPKG